MRKLSLGLLLASPFWLLDHDTAMRWESRRGNCASPDCQVSPMVMNDR